VRLDEQGRADLGHLEQLIKACPKALVSLMHANNEIGTRTDLQAVGTLARKHGALFHSDTVQTMGHYRFDLATLPVDFITCAAHKFHGPKGVGGLFVRRRQRRVKLQAQIVGGGQQYNFRSGTLNTTGIVGMHAALAACLQSLPADQHRIAALRSQLLHGLGETCRDIDLNGPQFTAGTPLAPRLAGNLNCSFYPIEGQSLMMAIPDLAVSSGSACTSANPSPSHVLQAIGLSEEQARSSLRFGIGRFNTSEEIVQTLDWLAAAYEKLLKLIRT